MNAPHLDALDDVEKVANNELDSVRHAVHFGIVSCHGDLRWVYVDRNHCNGVT